MSAGNLKKKTKSNRSHNNSSVVSPSHSITFSFEESNILQTAPVQNQIGQLNLYQMHVRRPSEKYIDYRKNQIHYDGQNQDIYKKSPSSPNLPSFSEDVQIKQNELQQIKEFPSNVEYSERNDDQEVSEEFLSNIEEKEFEQYQQAEISKTNKIEDNQNQSQLSIDQIRDLPDIKLTNQNSIMNISNNHKVYKSRGKLIMDKASRYFLNEDGESVINYLFQPIHAFNSIVLCYQLIISLSHLYVFGYISLKTALKDRIDSLFIIYLIVTFVIDTLLKLRIIEDPNTNANKINTQIVKKYLNKDLYFDILSIIPAVFSQKWIYLNFLYLFRINIIIHPLVKIQSIASYLSQKYSFFIITFIAIIYIYLFQIIVITITIFIDPNPDQSITFYLLQNHFLNSIKIPDNPIYAIILYLLILIQMLFYISIFFSLYQNFIQEKYFKQNYQLQFPNKNLFLYLKNQKKKKYWKNVIDDLQPEQQRAMKYSLYHKILSKLPIFKNSLNDHSLFQVCQLLSERLYKPNEEIIKDNDQNLYFIFDGSAQIYQQKSQEVFDITRLDSNEFINQDAFFSFQSSFKAKSIGYTRIIELNYQKFIHILKRNVKNYQKFKMLQDQLIFHKKYNLILSRCYCCEQSDHTINGCPKVHYQLNKNFIYLNTSEPNERQKFFRNYRLQYKWYDPKIILSLKNYRIIHQIIDLESDTKIQIKERQPEEIPDRQVNSPRTLDNQENSSYFEMKQISQNSNDQQQQLQEKFNGISPVTQVQQANSAFSQSSFYLAQKERDRENNSYNQKKPSNEKNSSQQASSNSDPKNKNSQQYVTPQNQGNLSIQPPSSLPLSGNQNNNSKMSHESSFLVQNKKKALQDSVFLTKQKIQQQHVSIDLENNNQYDKMIKQQTVGNPLQQQQQTERNKRKSISLISQIPEQILNPSLLQQNQIMAQQLPSQLNSGTNIASYRQGSGGSFRQNSDMQLIESRYGRGSSKFTGETAKQFMRNSLEIPNINIDFQFENNCQFSDYFPQNNVDQAIDSYHQYQNSRNSNSRNNNNNEIGNQEIAVTIFNKHLFEQQQQ